MGVRCFVDTSAWFSLMFAGDRRHAQVRSAHAELYSNGTLFVTSNLVLGELYTLLSARASAAGFRAFRDRILASHRARVLNPAPGQLDAAFLLLQRRKDRSYSFVDATSFVLMRDERIDTALTLDRHFAQEGFMVTPTPDELLHGPHDADVAKRPAAE
ncbi:MAG: type II toxin-antitoxin system VapC family toxin [Bacillota bacterium]|jgi:predicted nucleic acid-binding protein